MKTANAAVALMIVASVQAVQPVPAKDKPQEGEQAIGPARFTSHQDRGVETPAFRPGRKRRVTSPEMSAVLASVFACPGTGCCTPPA